MNSFLSWIGGKKLLRKEIVNRFPEKVDRYVEVFGGAAWVLFYKDKHANFEVYNDYNSELVNIFRCVKYHREELQRELNYFLNSREMFQDFLVQYKTRGLTDIQRAARYFMIIKTSYGSKGGTYGCVKKDTVKYINYLTDIQNRLRSVVIENRDFEKIITTYDREGTLFYLDPPYYGTENYYKEVDFTIDDHERLKQALDKIKGKFILSYNDCPEIRELYKDYKIEEIKRKNNLTSRYSNAEKEFNELLIIN
ncbi:DNA adenine methylase [Sedimentibacter acidaminivorans]|uniref:DNA adenine methylase n=1 Tax=Sedimentibacter acidaminivorans TaxID=913099 RepID=A0ABS4GGP6_9FIRM|nr:DNA adenine methylase [Sedimentibacter acidaminivorans]MBP1926829.1 DNA adenine methylase [Sedimentibacter acidaminivorans]